MNSDSHFIDIHCHTNMEQFDADYKEVIKRAHEKDVWIINVGVDKLTSQKAVEIAEQYEEGVYAVIGLHPTDSPEDFDLEFYKSLAKSKKVIAIGECGLDFFHIDPNKEENQVNNGSLKRQIKIFEQQIELALELDLPIMIHCRDAYKETLEVIDRYKGQNKFLGKKLRGDVHFFAGDVATAKAFTDRDFSLSFTGVITFTHDYDATIESVSVDNIMSETDSPFVAPVPYRKTRNEPAYVIEVVKRLAELKKMTIEQAKDTIFKNASNLFTFR